MKNKPYMYDRAHLQQIKTVFEAKTGVQLTKKRTRAASRRLAVALCAACLCAFAALPVLANHVPAAYNLLYQVSPGAAQFFRAVQISDEYDGVKMEVVCAYIHGNTAEIYVTLQDLTGNRVDGTTDLFDSYSINRPFDSSAFCRRIGYDEATSTATFLVTITEWGNRDITGEKITFSVRETLSHKQSYQDIQIPVDFSALQAAAQVQQVDSNGGGGNAYPAAQDQLSALVPAGPMPAFAVDGLELTGIGYVNGQLHIQIANANPLGNDNHGSLVLKKDGEEPRGCDYNFYFSSRYERPEDRTDYCEYVFDIPREEIGGYALYGDFVTSGMRTQGSWSVTFPLEQAE